MGCRKSFGGSENALSTDFDKVNLIEKTTGKVV